MESFIRLLWTLVVVEAFSFSGALDLIAQMDHTWAVDWWRSFVCAALGVVAWQRLDIEIEQRAREGERQRIVQQAQWPGMF